MALARARVQCAEGSGGAALGQLRLAAVCLLILTPDCWAAAPALEAPTDVLAAAAMGTEAAVRTSDEVDAPMHRAGAAG